MCFCSFSVSVHWVLHVPQYADCATSPLLSSLSSSSRLGPSGTSGSRPAELEQFRPQLCLFAYPRAYSVHLLLACSALLWPGAGSGLSCDAPLSCIRTAISYWCLYADSNSDRFVHNLPFGHGVLADLLDCSAVGLDV